MSSRAHNTYPIAIIGGGLTGKMMALCLSHSGYDCAIIAPRPQSDKPKDRRSTTIHNAGAKMLSALGLMDYLQGQMTPINHICVAVGPQKPYHSDWLLNWSSDEVMAYVIENHALDSALDSAINGLAKSASKTGAIHQIDDIVTGYHDDGAIAMIETGTGSFIKAQLVIACDGTKSQMRALVGLTAKIEETGQTALIANLDCGVPHNHTAYQRFLPTGPLALMPLEGQSVSLVWSTDTAQAKTLLSADPQAISQALGEAFGDELGKLTLQNALSSFPLRPHYNRRLSKGRVILAGDAAHAIHPLAGMGYNLALADAAILLDLLNEAHAKGLGPDHPAIKTAYRNRRMPEIIALATLTSQLNKMLSRKASPLSAIIAMGMSVVDKTPLKRTFQDIAMGGKLSSAPLLRGHLK